MVGLARSEESSTVDDDPGVIADRDGAVTLLRDDLERHGAPVYIHNLGGRFDEGTYG